MSPEEFLLVMEPLKTKYPKHYFPHVEAAIFEIIKNLTKNQADEMMGKIMLRSHFAPTEKDFKEGIIDVFRSKQFVTFKDTKQDKIFSEEERKEIWEFVKMAAQGEVDQESIKSYTQALNDTIEAFYKKRKHR